jgi:hypothetical protein
MGDVDQLPAPAGMDPTSLDAVAYAREQLPPEWRRSRLRFQFSNSAYPTKGVIKVHFFALLDRPVEDTQLRESFEAWNAEWREGRSDGVTRILDPALCDPIQLHFTAPPIVVGGPDPLEGRRSGVIPGASDTVELRLRMRHGRGFAPGRSATLEEIERDETGKAVAGREGLLLLLRLEVLRELRPETLDEFFAEVWRRFRERAKLAPTPGKSETYWTEDKVFAKCRGDWPNRERLMGRKPVEGVEPYWKSEPLEPEEVAAEIEAEVDAWLAEPHDLMLRVTAAAGKTRAACRRAARTLRPGADRGRYPA